MGKGHWPFIVLDEDQEQVVLLVFRSSGNVRSRLHGYDCPHSKLRIGFPKALCLRLQQGGVS